MRKTFWQYYWDSLHNFGEGIINIFIFLPYFFSVSALLKTLFYPWKNLIIKKTFVGFSLADWANRFAFNLISSSMGVVMRISIISFYFILQTIKKDIFKKKFIETHLLIEENRFFVENWFEKYYRQNLEKIQWWKLSNLFTYPPLARDWAVGYTPILDQYATDLATSSYLHHIKNIIDREKEITEVEQILTKSNESNVIIVGEEGVGKHTIIDALAKKIYLGKTNIHLMYRRILKLNMERILKEKNFEDLLEEAQQAKNIILFIDNFDKYINLSISLEKYAKSNLIQIIGTTTPFDYQSFIFPNEKINQMFSKVDVYEVTDEEAENILLESVFTFENHNKVSIFYETVKEVIEKSKFYLTYIPFPEKAVDLLDQACVYAVSNSPKTKDTPKVTPDTINQVLTEKIHIPITITKQMKEKLLNLELILSSRIIQQDEAIKKLSSALRRSFLLIGKRKKPLASFLFLGPTGVGKTETAKVVSNVFFEDLLLRFDMSEFQSKYDIPKLIGDSTNPGLLTQTIREQSYGVLLLDEIEKADKDLINIFLTIVDEGYFIDGKGKRVDCKNLVIIATSNAQNENTFSPEFLNRYDGIITFEFLNKESIRILAKKMIEKISLDIFKIYKVRIFVSEKTINFVSKKGFDSRFGARNLERTIRDEIEDKVSKLIFQDKAKPGETINL
ncbi:MAG: Endopeptidase clp ATP-binding chain a [Candidatus Levybacteria bacterium GW2011_GWA2_37_36]|nr:MAG: Endopeptidase clp ATP-binding chain a [Candidatus Levybacteria bacterium GW2011_GWA2_37_36]